MNRVLVDSSIIIDIWRRGKSAWPELQSSVACLSTVSYIEVLQGAHRRQKDETIEWLNQYHHLRLDEPICDLAVELIKIHSETDGLRLADSLIAATSLIHNLDLLTLNRRHFQKIADLKLI